MSRCPRGFNLGLFGAILVFAFTINVVLLLQRSFVPTKPKEQPIVIVDENEMKDVLGSLPMPEYDLHKGLLLGKKSSKVTLAIGMIVTVNALNQPGFAKTARQIIKQDPKPTGSRSLVIVLLLCDNRKTKVEKILDVLKSEFAGSLKQGYIQLVISPFDAQPDYFEALHRNSRIHQVSKTASRMNMRLSYLVHHSANVAKNFILVDDAQRLTGDAMFEIYKQIHIMTPRSLEVELTGGLCGRLYNGKFLPRLSSVLNTMAFVGSLDRMLFIYGFSSVNETKHKYQGRELFITEHQPISNPKAAITSTFASIHGGSYANAYYGKGPSWFYTPQKGNTFNIQLDKPTLLKRIAIDVGLDSVTRDPIAEAVLEISYDKDIDSNKCLKYDIVRSFEEASSIEVTHEKEGDMPVLQKPVHCIRIRVTKVHEQWGAIRMIVVEPK